PASLPVHSPRHRLRPPTLSPYTTLFRSPEIHRSYPMVRQRWWSCHGSMLKTMGMRYWQPLLDTVRLLVRMIPNSTLNRQGLFSQLLNVPVGLSANLTSSRSLKRLVRWLFIRYMIWTIHWI